VQQTVVNDVKWIKTFPIFWKYSLLRAHTVKVQFRTLTSLNEVGRRLLNGVDRPETQQQQQQQQLSANRRPAMFSCYRRSRFTPNRSDTHADLLSTDVSLPHSVSTSFAEPTCFVLTQWRSKALRGPGSTVTWGPSLSLPPLPPPSPSWTKEFIFLFPSSSPAQPSPCHEAAPKSS